VVLVLAGYYPPAYLAGGPTRSIPRIVEELKDEFAFRIITRDRDLGCAAPLRGVSSNAWADLGGPRCLYLSPLRLLLGGLLVATKRTRHDALYLNSMFSIQFSLAPLVLRKIGLIPRRALIVAPRGELDPSALQIKHARKRLVLWAVRALRLTEGAIWHAASPKEAEAISHQFGARVRVRIAADIPTTPGPARPRPTKVPGALELLFLSRISRMKNLDLAVSALKAIRGNVNFSVYGPIEDDEYWAMCERLATTLPSNVEVQYRGLVDPNDVDRVLAQHHLFFLPSRAESFGHAIVEALMAGCPVLISDQTPWHELEQRHAGWDLPLAAVERFTEVIDRCAEMTAHEMEVWSDGARRFGREIADDPQRDEAYRELFRATLPQGPPARVPAHG